MRDGDVTERKVERVNESEYNTVWKKRNAKGDDEEWGRGRSFWLRRPRRIHGRASFSKVSARTRMPLLDSRMGTGRINDRDRDRSPEESLPFVLRVFFPLPRRTMEIGKRPLSDWNYAENYRNFRCLPFRARARYMHGILPPAFLLSTYGMNKRQQHIATKDSNDRCTVHRFINVITRLKQNMICLRLNRSILKQAF